MNKQIECLEKSINEKWIPIVEGYKSLIPEGEDSDCECCRNYFWGGCGGCPIDEDTGFFSCHKTPHDIIFELFYETKNMTYDSVFELKLAAQMELDYLIDLRDRLKAKQYAKEQIEDARPGPGKD